MKCTLLLDGDSLEKKYYNTFLKDYFPSYERFWQKYIIPLRKSPKDIHPKTDNELKKIGKSPHDIYISQLHYSIFNHLRRVYIIIHIRHPKEIVGFTDVLIEGLTRLCGALDMADELLERFKNPKEYEPWDIKDSKKARGQWRKDNGRSLQKIRNYRNRLIHSPIYPIMSNMLPKIGKEDKYIDWRAVTDTNLRRSLSLNDFAVPLYILCEAWSKTLKYLEDHWKKHLLGEEK